MKGIIKMSQKTVKEFYHILMVLYMQEETVHLVLQVLNMKVIEKMIKQIVKVFFH
jgi:hypothetical protein